MNVNIMAVINGTEIAVERMKKAGKAGQIINTASMGKFFGKNYHKRRTIELIQCSADFRFSTNNIYH